MLNYYLKTALAATLTNLKQEWLLAFFKKRSKLSVYLISCSRQHLLPFTLNAFTHLLSDLKPSSSMMTLKMSLHDKRGRVPADTYCVRVGNIPPVLYFMHFLNAVLVFLQSHRKTFHQGWNMALNTWRATMYINKHDKRGRRVRVVQHVLVVQLMQVRSAMYQLSGTYQLFSWCKLDPTCASCPAC